MGIGPNRPSPDASDVLGRQRGHPIASTTIRPDHAGYRASGLQNDEDNHQEHQHDTSNSLETPSTPLTSTRQPKGVPLRCPAPDASGVLGLGGGQPGSTTARLNTTGYETVVLGDRLRRPAPDVSNVLGLQGGRPESTAFRRNPQRNGAADEPQSRIGAAMSAALRRMREEAIPQAGNSNQPSVSGKHPKYKMTFLINHLIFSFFPGYGDPSQGVSVDGKHPKIPFFD